MPLGPSVTTYQLLNWEQFLSAILNTLLDTSISGTSLLLDFKKKGTNLSVLMALVLAQGVRWLPRSSYEKTE